MTIPGSGSGTGFGGNIGGPQQPLQRELETTAWTEVNKSFLGIVVDTLAIPFTKFGGNLWKYESSANRPTLPPLIKLRVGLGSELPGDESWKAHFEDLIQKLPKDIITALKEEGNKSFDQRNPALMTLNYLLAIIAKFMSQNTVIHNQTEPDSVLAKPNALKFNTEQSQGLAAKGLQGAVSDGAAIYTNIMNYLFQKGANEPNFDSQVNFARQMGDAFSALTTLSNELSNPESLEDLQNRQTHIAGALATLNGSFQKSYTGEDLFILGSTFHTLGILASALANSQGSPSLFIALELMFAQTAPDSSQSALILDPLKSVLSIVSNALSGTLLSIPNQGAQRNLELLTQLSSVAAVSFGYLTAKEGLGILPNPDNSLVDEKQNRLFGFELATVFLTSANMIPTFFKEAAAASGIEEKNQTPVANILSALTLMLAITGASKGSERDFDQLIVGLKDHLQSYLSGIASFLNDGLSSKTFNGDIATRLSVGIQQALIALQDEDLYSFKNAYRDILELTGIPIDKILEGIKHMEKFADLVIDAWRIGPNDQTNTITGIANSA